MSTEEALLLEVCARLDDQLPRLVLADYLDEHDRGDEAAAWRATADRVPTAQKKRQEWGQPEDYFDWEAATDERVREMSDDERRARKSLIPLDVMHSLSGRRIAGLTGPVWWGASYPTARAALLDLIAAWVKVEEERTRAKSPAITGRRK